MRLVVFDYFRGIAILLIVAGHSYGDWVINSFGEKVLVNLISGGTALFVFISGYFFHHIYYENFYLNKFLVKKAKNIFLPYIMLSIFWIVFYSFFSLPLPYADELGMQNIEGWAQHSEMVVIYLWTGRISSAYWYIPFILIIFTISPLFIRYINISAINRIYIFIILLVAAMFIHRPAGNISPIHSVLYFMPIYMLGIICSIHSESVIKIINDKSLILGLIVLSLSALQALFYEGHGNFHKEEIFSYGGVDIIIIQKIMMCFFFLSVLQKYGNRNILTLKLLASSSFAIFFIHTWTIKILTKIGVLSTLEFLPEMGVFLITILLALLISYLAACIIKLVLHKNSRYVIGW